MNKITIFLILFVLIFSACKKDDPVENIEQYLSDNNLIAEKTTEGLYYIIENEGQGARPTISNEVTVNYTGRFTNGTTFDFGDGIKFPLSQVIEGWQIGIPLFKEGGKGVLIVPPSLGYGNNPPRGTGISSSSVLIFDVELIKVE